MLPGIFLRKNIGAGHFVTVLVVKGRRSDREDADFCGVDVVLGEDEYFLLGDNMALSRDSRIFGPVKRSALLGKVLRVVEL